MNEIKELRKENTELKQLIKRLVDNAPDTYSGTDIMRNQSKMFAFSSAMNEAIDLLKILN